MEAKEINIGCRQMVNPQELISLKGEIKTPLCTFSTAKRK
jgi:hypothetical protein